MSRAHLPGLAITSRVSWRHREHKVTAVARRMDRLEVLVADIVAGGVAIAAYCDVTGHGSIQAAIKIAADTHGPIDILVNNAGNTSVAPVLEHDISQWNKVIETNLTGSWVVAQEVAKLMAPRGRGSIINIASAFAIRTYARVSGYAGSKAAIIHLTRNMAIELAPIRTRARIMTGELMVIDGG